MEDQTVVNQTPPEHPRNNTMLAVLLTILIMLVIGGVFWWAFQSQADSQSNQTNTESNTEGTAPIKSKSDLKESEDSLNKTDIDSELDTSEIDEALN